MYLFFYFFIIYLFNLIFISFVVTFELKYEHINTHFLCTKGSNLNCQYTYRNKCVYLIQINRFN